MRVAALYDIHGNLPALEAVLAEVRDAGVERIVVGGDVCPDRCRASASICSCALDIPADFIIGNGDRETARRDARPGQQHHSGILPRGDALECGAADGRDDLQAIDAWPLTHAARRSTASARCCSVMPRRATTPRSS